MWVLAQVAYRPSSEISVGMHIYVCGCAHMLICVNVRVHICTHPFTFKQFLVNAVLFYVKV